MKTASEWVRTDPEAVRKDVARLGLDGAVEYQMGLVADRQASGDHRWDGVTVESMRKAVVESMVREGGR